MRTVSRRQVLQILAGVGSGVAVTALLEACTPPGAPAGAPPATSAAAVATTAPAAPAATQSSQAAASSGSRPDWATAAQPYKGKQVNILMSAGPWGKSHEVMRPEFNKLTGMNVVYDLLPEEQITTKLQTSVLSRSGEYDAVVMVWDLIAQYDTAGTLADLTPYYNSPDFPQWDINEYPQKIVQFVKPGGRFIGIPVSVAAQIMMYRTDLFSAAGLQGPAKDSSLSWQQVYDYAKALTKPGLYGSGHGWKAGGIYAETMNILPGDKPILDDAKRLSIYRDQRVLDIYDIWARMYKEGSMSQSVLADNIVDAWGKFQSGQLAMQPLTWPVAIADMEDPQKSQVAGKIGYAATPGGTPRIGGWAATVLTDSKNKEAAYLHLAWLASNEISSREVVENGNYDMSYTKYFQDNLEKFRPDLMKRPNGAAEIEGMVASWAGIKGGRMVDPTVPAFALLGDAMYPFMAKVVTGDLSAKDGLNQAADAGDKILAAG
jgi:ABC-type glycerol-3-phosphate transport system substrate-binding protein